MKITSKITLKGKISLMMGGISFLAIVIGLLYAKIYEANSAYVNSVWFWLIVFGGLMYIAIELAYVRTKYTVNKRDKTLTCYSIRYSSGHTIRLMDYAGYVIIKGYDRDFFFINPERVYFITHQNKKVYGIYKNFVHNFDEIIEAMDMKEITK